MTLKKRGNVQKTIITRIDRMPIRKLRVSWWTDHCQPNERTEFMADAKRREQERISEFQTQYAKTETAYRT